jgi:hypothetical protein
MIKALSLLLLTYTPCFGQSSYIIEDLEKEGQVQAFKMNIDNKFDVTGGTVSGPTSFASSSTFSGATSFSAPVAFSNTVGFSNTVEFSNNVNFTGATSTATFSGWVDIGLSVHEYNGVGVSRVACPSGKKAIGCSCYHPQFNATIVSVFPSTETYNAAAYGSYVSDGNTDANSCSCISSVAANITSVAICVRIK